MLAAIQKEPFKIVTILTTLEVKDPICLPESPINTKTARPS
jgi:hypothetical protein